MTEPIAAPTAGGDALRNRLRQHEWMDHPAADPLLLCRSLRFLRRINALLGYTRSTLWHLDRFTRQDSFRQPITVLDVATGSADMPAAIVRWSRRRRLDVRVVALDRHPQTVAYASQQLKNLAHHGSVQIIRADALQLPFSDGSFDFVISSLFLHHLDEQPIMQALREMDRVARCGVIIADLLRNRRALAWITLLTLLANPMVRHDARASVRQSFLPEEILTLCRRAGLGYLRYYRHFAHRFVLAGQKRP
ncbi:MAG TPA: methyltransferase domain-containing protein [Tepidisphaeraceae bacterium]|nr:methyltransferase domain-containing protein [Tepidisphaeraceae bacterium]